MAGLEAIAAQPDQKNKIEQYKAVLQQIVSSGSVQECRGFADHSKAFKESQLLFAQNKGGHIAASHSPSVCYCSSVGQCASGCEQAATHRLCTGALEIASRQPQGGCNIVRCLPFHCVIMLFSQEVSRHS